MRIIAINHDPARLETLPPSWEVLTVTTPIVRTYRDLSRRALREEWDTSVVVVQDDVRFDQGQPKRYPDETLVVYGQTTGVHVCPRAFAASPSGWDQLREAWSEWAGGTACRGFTLIANRAGLILDVTHHA